jgi:hypothetical protein
LFVDDVSSEKKKKKKKKKHEENGEADVTMDITVNTSHEDIYCRLVEVYKLSNLSPGRSKNVPLEVCQSQHEYIIN